MKSQPVIVPAILAEELNSYIEKIKEYQKFSSIIHIDVMDGIYVSSISPKVNEILDVVKNFDISLNIHLMVSQPDKILVKLNNAKNINIVYIHAEVFSEEFLKETYPFQLGLVLNPESMIDNVKDIIQNISIVQVMTVKPGLQGQPFFPQALEKIKYLREELNYKGEIHIDGHVNDETLAIILKFLPDVINVGSFIQNSSNSKNSYNELLNHIQI